MTGVLYAPHYTYTYNVGQGTSSALCGKDAACSCCRKHSAGTCTNLFPNSTDGAGQTTKELCEYGNNMDDGFIYTYNEGRYTN